MIMEKGTVSELLHVHIQNTSAHGLPNVLRAKSNIGKLIWLCLFVAGIGMLIWQIVDRLDHFFSFKYDVNLEIEFSKEVPFPAVTFCNMNPLRTSAIRQSAANLFDILQELNQSPSDPSEDDVEPPNDKVEDEKQTGKDTMPPDMTPVQGPTQGLPPDPSARSRRRRQLPRQMTSTPTMTEDMTTEGVESWESRVRPEFFSSQSVVFAAQESITDELSKLNTKDQKLLGHQLETMLLKCLWQGYPCAPDNFTTFINSHYGNCYTFGTGDLKSTHPGPLNGLSLELFIEHDEYMQTVSDTAGVILVVHESDKMPLPEDDGIQISTGMNTAIGIKQLKISRLSWPYANCTKKGEHLEGLPPDYYRETFGVSYSLKTCERSCYQNAVIRNCSCADSSYPSPKDKQIGPCKTTESKLCRYKMELAYQEGAIACDCFNPCEETVYIPSISMGYWPSDKVKEGIYGDIMKTNHEARELLRKEADPAEWLEKNVAKVQIFFSEFNYETITQSPSYLFGDLLSDIGGQLGLWLGISVLSIFEIIEATSAVVALLWYGLKHSGKLNARSDTAIHVINPPIRPTMSDDLGTSLPPDKGKYI